jgi:hypothetical protein
MKCKQCNTGFEVTAEDRKFYESVSPEFGGKKYLIPEPTLCPDCRCQKRLAFRNERNLYYRKCDLTGGQIISTYSPESKITVYKKEEWWSDKWDPTDYGKDYDFSRPFFEQFDDLLNSVPLMSLLVDSNINSDYVNQSGWGKNCYLCFCSDHDADCLYLQDVYFSKNVLDSLYCYSLEFSFECVDCKDSYKLFYSQNSSNCSESWYLYDCINCKNCFACTGLRNKEFCFFNEQLTKDEYIKRISEFKKMPFSQREFIKQKIEKLFCNYPRQYYIGQNNENVIGNYIFNSKNAINCFDSIDLEDSKYCTNMKGASNCYDVNRWGHHSEYCYECSATGEGTSNILLSSSTWGSSSNVLYSLDCISIRNCFGCVGMRHKKYCIFNKQYSKEEYEALVPRIIEHMKKTKEWGEFFPIAISPFAYNETIASEYYPLTKNEVKNKKWQWRDNNEAKSYKGPVYKIQDKIEDVSDDICNAILICEKTGKPYKIIPQELKFYREHGIPIPRQCPDERHRIRMNLRNPRKLYARQCDKCQAGIQTTYAPDRLEKVYCEECYLKEVY